MNPQALLHPKFQPGVPFGHQPHLLLQAGVRFPQSLLIPLHPRHQAALVSWGGGVEAYPFAKGGGGGTYQKKSLPVTRPTRLARSARSCCSCCRQPAASALAWSAALFQPCRCEWRPKRGPVQTRFKKKCHGVILRGRDDGRSEGLHHNGRSRRQRGLIMTSS